MTHSYALLLVSKASYDDIRSRLDAAGYQHCFRSDKPHIILGEVGLAVDANSPLYPKPLTDHDIEQVLDETGLDLSVFEERPENKCKGMTQVLAEGINKHLGISDA